MATQITSPPRNSALQWLRSLFPNRKRRGTPPSYEPQNRGLVITICILISILLWFIFSMQETHTILIELPTEIRNLPPDEALTVLPPRTVKVQVQGEGIQLLRLYYNRPVVPIDAGADEISFEDAVAELLSNVQLESVIPRTFVVRKEPRITRTVPVEPRIEIRTPPAYDLLGPIRLRPDSVAVSGAVSILENLRAWPTEHRVFVNVRDTLRAVVALADTLTGLVLREFDEVSIEAIVEEFTEAEREIRVLVPGAPLGEEFVQLSPPTIRVRYLVPLSQYDASMTAEDFFAMVPYDEIRSDTTGLVRPRLHLPEGLVLREVTFSPLTLHYFNVLVDEN